MKDFILSICRNADVILIAGLLLFIIINQDRNVKTLKNIEKKLSKEGES